jgi:hypothetical protein
MFSPNIEMKTFNVLKNHVKEGEVFEKNQIGYCGVWNRRSRVAPSCLEESFPSL